ncbi:hypothetical protein EDB19DRAFT_833708 [Suillus lakei]|nr:hypothetical protein EDB19DRAFT_833708 [Suillus lakei]
MKGLSYGPKIGMTRELADLYREMNRSPRLSLCIPQHRQPFPAQRSASRKAVPFVNSKPVACLLALSYRRRRSMCHRQLRFTKNTACGHLSFQGDTYIDCCARDCMLSTSHPTTCGSPGRPCNCRRYYSQPQRLITLERPGACPQCPQ